MTDHLTCIEGSPAQILFYRLDPGVYAPALIFTTMAEVIQNETRGTLRDEDIPPTPPHSISTTSSAFPGGAGLSGDTPIEENNVPTTGENEIGTVSDSAANAVTSSSSGTTNTTTPTASVSTETPAKSLYKSSVPRPKYLDYLDDEFEDYQPSDAPQTPQVPSTGFASTVRLAERKKQLENDETIGLRIQVKQYQRLLRNTKQTSEDISGSPMSGSSAVKSTASQSPYSKVEDADERRRQLEERQRTEALERENQNLMNELVDMRRQVNTRSNNTYYTNGAASSMDDPYNGGYSLNNSFSSAHSSPIYHTPHAYYPHGGHYAPPANHHFAKRLNSPASLGRESVLRQSPRGPRRTNMITHGQEIQQRDMDSMVRRNQIIQDVIDGDDPMNYFGSSSDTALNQQYVAIHKIIEAIIQWDISEEMQKRAEQGILKYNDQFMTSNFDKSAQTDILMSITGWVIASRERLMRKLEDMVMAQDSLEDRIDLLWSENQSILPGYEHLRELCAQLHELLEARYQNYDPSNIVEYVEDCINVAASLEEELRIIRQHKGDEQAAFDDVDKGLREELSQLRIKLATTETRYNKMVQDMESLTDEMTQRTEELLTAKQRELEDYKAKMERESGDLQVKYQHLEVKHVEALKENRDLADKIAILDQKNNELNLLQVHHDQEESQLIAEVKALKIKLEDQMQAISSRQVSASSESGASKDKKELLRLKKKVSTLEAENSENEKRLAGTKKLTSTLLSDLIAALEPKLGEEWAIDTAQRFERLPDGTQEQAEIKLKVANQLVLSEIKEIANKKTSVSDEARLWRAKYDEMKKEKKKEQEDKEAYMMGAKETIRMMQNELEEKQKEVEKNRKIGIRIGSVRVPDRVSSSLSSRSSSGY